MENISPALVFHQVSAAIPDEFHKNIIIIGSLAAGYHFFGDNDSLQMRTKDVDCLLSPHIEAVGSGTQIVEKLINIGWKQKADGEFSEPGNDKIPDRKLPLIRLYPPESKDWFLEFLIEPEEDHNGIQWKRIILSNGHFALCGFQFLRITNYNPKKAETGIYYARPEMMALANILEHPRIKPETMSGLIENRKIKRSNKDLGRALAIVRLYGDVQLDEWLDLWEDAVRSRISEQLFPLMKNAGDGVRELIGSVEDMEESVFVSNNGLLAFQKVTKTQFEASAKRLLSDVIEPFENIFK